MSVCFTSVLDGRIHFGKFSYNPGGVARNICEALYKLGCRPNFISVVGDDIQGKVLMAQIPEEIGRQLQVVKGQSTAQCVVVLDKKGDCSFLMGDMSIHESITPELIRTKEDIIKFSPLMILDANISLKSIEESLKLAEKYKIPVFFEPTDITVAKRPFETPFWKSIKFITPNLSELKQIASFLKISLSNTPTSKIEEAAGIARELAQYIDNIIVTLGPEGVVIARKGLSTEPLLSNSKRNNVYVRHYPAKIITKFTNVSGAGDCLASGFIAALLSGLPEEKCVGVGFAAASCALHSQPPVPHKLFDKSHESWNKITTIYKNL